MSTFSVKVTYHIETIVSDSNQLGVILDEINLGVKRGGWVVDLSNTENDLNIIRSNIVEIGSYALAKCLACFPDEKMNELALSIFQESKLRLLSSGIFYQERLDSLNQVNKEIINLLLKISGRAFERKRYAAAIYPLSKILLIDTQNTNAIGGTAYCHWKNGDKDEAKKFADRLWNVSPGSPDGRINKAFFSITRKHYKVALRQYKLIREKGIGSVEPLWTVDFLQEEYKKNQQEHAYLFCSGFLNTYWGDLASGKAELQDFISKTEGISEYLEMRNSANGILTA